MDLRAKFTLKLDSFLVGFLSIVYGVQILTHPFILETYAIYEIIREIFDINILGIAFVLLGAGELIGLIFDIAGLKRLSIRGLLFLWLLFLIAFVITPPANTIWILALSNVILAIGATVKEG